MAPTAAIDGAPQSLTSATSVTLSVFGQDVIAYRYKLDSGAYSGETPIATPITLTSLKTGVHSVSVIGKDSAGNWQGEEKATTAGWTIEFSLHDGDMNGDGKVDIADALKALQVAVGILVPTLSDLAHGDVAPLVSGKPVPDGKIGVGDALIIMKKVVGLVSW